MLGLLMKLEKEVTMPFQPKTFLEGMVLKPGTYSLKLLRWDRTVGQDGHSRFLLEFEVAEDPDRTVIEWWGAGNEVAVRRAIQVLGIVKPEARNDTFPGVEAFFEAVVKELVKLSEEEKWLKAVIVVGTRADGSPVARVRQFMGFAEGDTKGKRRKDDVPF